MKRLIRRTAPTPPVARVSATVFHVNRGESPSSRQLATLDEFAGVVTSLNGSILLPVPYKVETLYSMREQSNMLAQCIEAYVTNIVLTGWEVGPLYRDLPADVGESFELQSFLDNPNVDQSMVAVMSEVVRDRETYGFAFLEVVRDALGRVAVLRHAQSRFTRLCSKHNTPVEIRYQIMRGRRVSMVNESKRFRRYMQMVAGRTVWFKEFGDPRRMDSVTGFFEGEAGFVSGRDATELIHFKLPSDEAYGVPRWINQLPSILGSREAEEVNMRYFQNNTVPPMMLLVGNGRLTKTSHEELQRTLTQEGIGSDRQHKVLLLEAVGESDSLDGKSNNVDLRVEKLTDSRQSDGLFKEYDQGNMAKVRSSFRLPPVLVGMSQDVNFATASTSVFVAESQVFAPERSTNDDILNRLLVNGFSGLGLRTVKLVSRTPSITSPEMVIKTLTALNVMGAVSPRSAQEVANGMLQLEIGAYPKPGEDGYEEWMDRPLVLTTGAAKTHEAQSVKDQSVKGVEAEGDVGPSQPKHGSE